MVACQAPLSMGLSRQDYWSRWHWGGCPPPEDLPDPGIEPMSLMSPHWQVGSLPLAPPEKPVLGTRATVQNQINPCPQEVTILLGGQLETNAEMYIKHQTTTRFYADKYNLKRLLIGRDV